MSTVNFRAASARSIQRVKTKKTAKASGRSALPGGVPGTPSVRGTDRRKGVSDNAFGRAIGAAPSPGLGPARTLQNPTPLVTPSRPGGKRHPKGTHPASTTSQHPTTPRSTTTASTTTRQSTGSAAPSGTTSAAAATSPVASAAARHKAKTTKRSGGTTTTASASSAADTVGEDWVTQMYAAANRQLDNQQRIIDAQRAAKLADQQAFDKWVAGQRTSATDTLKAQFEKSAADAQTARQASYDAIQKYAANATAQAGGNAQMLGAAGQPQDVESYGFKQNATAADGAGGAFTQSALTQRDQAQQEMDKARAANLVAQYNADQAKGTQALQQQRQQLGISEIKDRAAQEQANRQYALDQQAANWLQGKQEAELNIKQYQAQTERLGVRLTAKARQDANRIAALYKKGTLDLKAEDQKLKRLGYKLSVRKQIFAEAKAKAGGTAGQAIEPKASKFMLDWLKTQGVTSIGPGDSGIAAARQAVQALFGAYPGMSAVQAQRILGGHVDGSVMQDARIQTAIAQAAARAR